MWMAAHKTIADALAEIDRREAAQRETAQRERIALLDAGIKQHTLRRDAAAVAEQIEHLVAVQHAAKRPAWHADFQLRYDGYWEEGAAKGINFSLEVAIECARHMFATARNAEERGFATNLLANALQTLGERDSDTTRLEQAVTAYSSALEYYTPKSTPFDWALTQNNLGNALQTLGVRESGTRQMEKAVKAYRRALEEFLVNACHSNGR